MKVVTKLSLTYILYTPLSLLFEPFQGVCTFIARFFYRQLSIATTSLTWPIDAIPIEAPLNAIHKPNPDTSLFHKQTDF